MRKFNLFVDYCKSEYKNISFTAKDFREAGKMAEEIIDQFSQEERQEIYCFTLENGSGKTLGRFRPHRYYDNITFAFYFE